MICIQLEILSGFPKIYSKSGDKSFCVKHCAMNMQECNFSIVYYILHKLVSNNNLGIS